MKFHWPGGWFGRVFHWPGGGVSLARRQSFTGQEAGSAEFFTGQEAESGVCRSSCSVAGSLSLTRRLESFTGQEWLLFHWQKLARRAVQWPGVLFTVLHNSVDTCSAARQRAKLARLWYGKLLLIHCEASTRCTRMPVNKATPTLD